MKSIRLAIIFDQEIRFGGGYQQAINAAMLVKSLPRELAEVVFFTTSERNLESLSQHGIDAIFLKISYFSKILRYLKRSLLLLELSNVIKYLGLTGSIEKILTRYHIDLVYFLSPSPLARDLEKTNFIATIWDLCHRDNPEFPEIREGYQFEKREAVYKHILPKATAILVDSYEGKVNVVRRYCIDDERVYVMPFQAMASVRDHAIADGLDIDISKIYSIDIPYIFYPAQFWPHKNHVYILDGLKELESSYGLTVGAIFSGGDQGNLRYVKDYAKMLGISSRVRFAGFVPNEEIPALYKKSLALVMPTYFGPTNLPPIEAFELGVPVLYSDLPGLRDQVGDAALLMNLNDPGSMALHLSILIKDVNLRKNLVMRGRARLNDFQESKQIELLLGILESFRQKRQCWE
jgi:glycosyltransferase involved in cell wall biosynthesis